MRYRNNDSGKRIQIIFQDRQRRDIDIVCDLVQKQHIGRRGKDFQKIKPFLFASGKLFYGRILHGRIEKKLFQKFRRADQSVFCRNIFRHIFYVIDHSLAGVHLLWLLGKITDLYRLSQFHRTAVRLRDPGNDLQKSGFAASVGTDDPQPLIFKHNIIKITDTYFLSEAFKDVVKLYGFLSHPGLHRINLHFLILRRSRCVLQRFQTFQAGSLFRASGAASPFRPLHLHPQDTVPFSPGGSLHFLSFRFQFQETGILRLIHIYFPVADLQDLIGDTVKKISVVRHHDHRPFISVQVFLQPCGHLIVQMVGGLVQDQHIRRVYQNRRQRHPFLLASGKMIDLLLMIHDTQPVQHHTGVCLRSPVLLSFLTGNIRQDSLALRKFRMLAKERQPQAVLEDHLSAVRRLQSCKYPEKSGFSRSVNTDDTDLVALMDPAGNIVKDHLVAINFADVFHI